MNSQNDIEANFLVIESLFNKVKQMVPLNLIVPRNFCLFCRRQMPNVRPQHSLTPKAFRKSCSVIIRSDRRGTPCPFRLDILLLRMVVFVQSVFALALNVLKHRYDKIHLFDVQVGDAWWRSRIEVLNLVQMSLW
jgi:nitrilase